MKIFSAHLLYLVTIYDISQEVPDVRSASVASHYGEIEVFILRLKPYVSVLYFVDTRHPDFAPRFLNTPFVFGQMGLIYEKK